MKSIKTSVIIPNYNTSDLTIRLVKSLLINCEFPDEDKEIIIIDDGSKKSELDKLYSKDKLGEMLTELKVPESIRTNIRVKLLYKNLGVGNAINEGIILAKGKYIVRFDNDTKIIEGRFIDKLIKFLQDDKKIGLVTCLTDNISSQSQKIVIPDAIKDNPDMITDFVSNRDVEEIVFYEKYNKCFAGFCMAFRKSEVGEFATEMKMYGEDNLKYLDYVRNGFKCGVAQKLFIIHDYHGTTKHIDQKERKKESEIASKRFIEEANK